MKSRVSVSDFTPTAQGAMDGFSAGEKVGLMLEGPLAALDKAQGGQDAGRGEADRGSEAQQREQWLELGDSSGKKQRFESKFRP